MLNLYFQTTSYFLFSAMNIFRKLEQYWQHPVLYWPLVILIAAATPLTFAPYYHFWLMPLLFGALIRLIELRPRFAVSTAYLFGLIAYTAQFYWIHTALHDVSGFLIYTRFHLLSCCLRFLPFIPPPVFGCGRSFICRVGLRSASFCRFCGRWQNLPANAC